MDTQQNRFFDPVCPALPVLHADDQQISAELADSLASHGVGTADFYGLKSISEFVCP